MRRVDLASRPSPEQIAAFRRLTPEQRFHWLVDTLAMCFELTPPEQRARWHTLKRAQTKAVSAPRTSK